LHPAGSPPKPGLIALKRTHAEPSALKRENGMNRHEEQMSISQICELFLKGAVEDYRKEGAQFTGSVVQVTIPLVQQSVATANVTTIGGSCQTGFDCVDFTLAVPGVNAFVGSFSGSGTQYTQGSGAVSYQVDGQPVNHADGTPVCSQTDAKSSAVAVMPGNSFSTGPRSPGAARSETASPPVGLAFHSVLP
jgi:hypothetical protein